MHSYNLSKTTKPKQPSSGSVNTGQSSASVQWPFPQKLLQPSDQWFPAPVTRTFADMTTELGEAKW